jgi:hypothetical protein
MPNYLKWNNLGKAISNHPFGNGLYHHIPPKKNVIWGMVYYCFTHIKHMIEQLLKTTNNTSEITTDLPLPVEKARQGARVWSSNPCVVWCWEP